MVEEGGREHGQAKGGTRADGRPYVVVEVTIQERRAVGSGGEKASDGPLYCHALVMFQCRKRAGDPCVVMHLSGSVGSTILHT